MESINEKQNLTLNPDTGAPLTVNWFQLMFDDYVCCLHGAAVNDLTEARHRLSCMTARLLAGAGLPVVGMRLPMVPIEAARLQTLPPIVLPESLDGNTLLVESLREFLALHLAVARDELLLAWWNDVRYLGRTDIGVVPDEYWHLFDQWLDIEDVKGISMRERWEACGFTRDDLFKDWD